MRTLGLLCLSLGLAVASSAQPGTLDPSFGTEGQTPRQLFEGSHGIAISSDGALFFGHGPVQRDYFSILNPTSQSASDVYTFTTADLESVFPEFRPVNAGGVATDGTAFYATASSFIPGSDLGVVPLLLRFTPTGLDSTFHQTGYRAYETLPLSLRFQQIESSSERLFLSVANYTIPTDPSSDRCGILAATLTGDLISETPVLFPANADCANGKLFARPSDAVWIETQITDTRMVTRVTPIREDGTIDETPVLFEVDRPGREILHTRVLPSQSGGFLVTLTLLNRQFNPSLTISQEILRFTDEGILDPRFTPRSPLLEQTYVPGLGFRLTVAESPDGSILIAHTYRGQEENVLAALRLHADGTLDPTFGENGQIDLVSRPRTSDGYQVDSAQHIRLADDGGAYIAVKWSIPTTNTSYLYGIKLRGDSQPNDAHSAHSVLERISLSPNPAASSTTLHFSLDSPAEATISVYDALGRIVHIRPSETLRAGANTLSLDTHTFTPGVHAVVVRAGAERWTSMLTVTR